MSAEADAPKPMKPLAVAETAVRRFLLMVGFGFMAFVAGSILGASLQNRLVPRLEGAGPFLGIVTFFLVQGLWVMIVLPAFSHIAARFLELKPWSTAVIGAGTGMLFQLALQYVSVGAEGIAGAPTQQALRLLGIGTGIVLTAIAVKRGRELARVAEERAKVEAEKKKHQYDEFVKQAEALADRREQVPIAAAAPVDPAGVEAPGAPAPTPEPAPTGLPPKP